MKIVISPAKTLDFKSDLPTTAYTQPDFLEEAAQINRKLERKSKKELKDLMKISDALAELNYERYKEFATPFTPENSRPAVYAYAGDVYEGLDVYSLPVQKIDQLQSKLRILTGMYGILKPLDLIQPYRLEMGNPLQVGTKKNLYEFWKEKITSSLNQELREDELFINLASMEYFKSIDVKSLKVPVVSPVFKDYKNGSLKTIALYAKKARGSMVRYIIDHDIDSLEGVLGYDYDGYAFSEKYTEKENQPVFVR